MINHGELRKLKKSLNLYKAIQCYHNKHVDGSGNFGMTLYPVERKGDYPFYDLNGLYDPDKNIYSMRISYKWGHMVQIPRIREMEFNNLLLAIKTFMDAQ